MDYMENAAKLKKRFPVFCRIILIYISYIQIYSNGIEF